MSSSTSRANEEPKKRRIQSIVNDADVEELRKHYRFVPSGENPQNWQERMTDRYQAHLHRDFVLADLTRAANKQLGLRWRTIEEVKSGKGESRCGNKHCPETSSGKKKVKFPEDTTTVSEEDERSWVRRIPHGEGLTSFEVPFNYIEADTPKTELVQLVLCLRCAPYLFQAQGKKEPYLAAQRAREKQKAVDKRDKKRSRRKR